jgi:hypothetical protein
LGAFGGDPVCLDWHPCVLVEQVQVWEGVCGTAWKGGGCVRLCMRVRVCVLCMGVAVSMVTVWSMENGCGHTIHSVSCLVCLHERGRLDGFGPRVLLFISMSLNAKCAGA